MNSKILPFAIAILFLGTGCAHGPSVVSLGSYFAQLMEPAESGEPAQATPAPGETVVERTVEEVPVERVIRERVIHEVPVERESPEEVVIEEPKTVQIVSPQRVYVSGGWYEPGDVVITHIHGPGCGHYFYNGIWYDDPDLVIVGAYTPSCRYVYYDDLWYPRTDVFLRRYSYYHRRSFGAAVWFGLGPWGWHGRRYWDRGRDRDVDVNVNVYNNNVSNQEGAPEAGSRRPPRTIKTSVGTRVTKAPRMTRRDRPILVNDNVSTQTKSKLDARSSGVAPVAQSRLRGTNQSGARSLPSRPSLRTPGFSTSPVKTTRGLKDRRSADAVKDRRSLTGAVAERSTPKSVRTTKRKASSRHSATYSVRGSHIGTRTTTTKTRYRGTSRASARRSASSRIEAQTVGTGARSALTTSSVASSILSTPETKPSRTIRQPGVVNVGRPSRTRSARTTTVVPRSRSKVSATSRAGRPVLETQSQSATTGVSPGRRPSRSTTSLGSARSHRTTSSSSRKSYTPTTSRRSSGAPVVRTAPRPSSSWRSSYSSRSSSRSSRTYAPPVSRSSRSFSRPSYRSSPSYSRSSSRSARSSYRSAPSLSRGRSFSPSVSRSRSAPSRSSSGVSARSSGARSARTAR